MPSFRRAFRQLEAFLRFGAFNAGASLKELCAAEEHLGAPLPWQVSGLSLPVWPKCVPVPFCATLLTFMQHC